MLRSGAEIRKDEKGALTFEKDSDTWPVAVRFPVSPGWVALPHPRVPMLGQGVGALTV